MKILKIIFVLFVISVFVNFCTAEQTIITNELNGKWAAFLKTPGAEFVIYADIVKDSNNTSRLYISSPKQKQYNVPTDTLIVTDSIDFTLNKYKIHYKGIFDTDSNRIVGIWKQDNFEAPLIFYRPDEIYRTDRPQHPFKPYGYNSDSVYFNNKEGIRLAGTLTYPFDDNKVFPTVLLINGSGKQDRDETMYRHKPFLVLSDYLTKKGFAVLRLDDRGVGESLGSYEKATTKDFTADMEDALNFLKTKKFVDSTKIHLIGFNEGALIAANIANKKNDIKSVVLLSAPGLTGKEILLIQTKYLQEKSGIPDSVIERDLKINKKIYHIIETVKDSALAYEKLRKLYSDFTATLSTEDFWKKKYSVSTFKRQIKFMLTPWFRYYLTFDPRTVFEKLTIPVLILYGGKDVQIKPEENLKAIITALKKAGNKNVKSIVFPNLNHLFQKSFTGLPNEYSKIKQTISPEVMDTISTWLSK